MTSIFISYSRVDSIFTQELVNDLRRRGYDVWQDVSVLRGGQQWMREIDRALRACDVFVLVLSPDSVGSEWVSKETLLAMKLDKPIIPLMWRKTELPVHLVDYQIINFQEDRSAAFRQLIEALEALPILNIGSVSALTGEATTGRPGPKSRPGGMNLVYLLLGAALIILFFAFGLPELIQLISGRAPQSPGTQPVETTIASSPMLSATATSTWLKNDDDRDGLTNDQELQLGTLPNVRDTDEDGLSDGNEVARGTDPLRDDTDDDGLKDGLEVSQGSNPLNPDTDDDGLRDNIDPHPLFTPTPFPATQLTATQEESNVLMPFENGCIANIWTPYLGEGHSVDSRGCWELQDWGIEAESPNDLLIDAQPIYSGVPAFRGIYTTIPTSADIRFTVRIDQITTQDILDAEFLFGFIPQSASDPRTQGSYFFFMLGSDQPGSSIFMKLREPDRQPDRFLEVPPYTLGDSHNILLRIDGSLLEVFMDGNVIAENVSIPAMERAFWIGYRLFNGASLKAYVADLTVTETSAHYR